MRINASTALGAILNFLLIYNIGVYHVELKAFMGGNLLPVSFVLFAIICTIIIVSLYRKQERYYRWYEERESELSNEIGEKIKYRNWYRKLKKKQS